MKILLFGYGNIDRQDDGVAWHILRGVAEHYHVILPVFPEETTSEITESLTCSYALQLTPESAEWVSQFEKVIFIDAHTGSVEEPLHVENLDANFQTSPFTHHLTPQTCLALAESLYGKAPAATLISVRGYEFGFSQQLSAQTGELALQAIRKIVSIID
ncbi:MAG TPA: hydrogenase maturation protease [Bellilinea sp.]|nr:hydrogenase maturation protease [Bellilinea sp.]